MADLTKLTSKIALSIWLVAGFGINSAISEELPTASAARVAGDIERTRFVADLSKSVAVRAFALDNPYRVIVDLPQTNFAFPKKSGNKGRGLVSAWRFGLFAAGKSRIVLDVTAPVRIDKAFVLKAVEGQPARLVVDLVKVSAAAFSQAQADAARVVAETTVTPATRKGDRLTVRNAKKSRPLIVIDPGHGGLDAGAVGKAGHSEKDIVLEFSKSLKLRLEKSGRYDVHLTREEDVFLPLRKRVRLARDQRADLLISVHADSVREKNVRGATVYTLSEKASDRQAAALAAKENRSDVIAGLELADEPRDVGDILIDLTRRETKNYSIHFARTLINELRGSTRLIRNAHRSAGFMVLRAPDVPSVLVELGYLSNAKDEKLLVSAEWQTKMVDEIAIAVRTYFGPRLAGGLSK